MSARPSSVAVLLSTLLALVGCSTVPTSSPVVEITQAPTRVVESVGIEPLPPAPGASPEEIVNDFIDAAASTVPRHPVARQYLTPDAAESWSDVGISVIGTDFATVTTDPGTVTVTANLIGKVDSRGVFTVADRGVFTRQFRLEQIDGEWRITDPQEGLIMLEPDFRRLYDQVDAYFLDPTRQRVVPDPRYLITGGSQATTIVERVIEGPSAPLAAGVQNPLAGVELEGSVTVQGQTATVELTGLPAEPSPLLAQISAQLVWTLQQLDQPQIRDVIVLLDGEPVVPDGVPARQTVEDWASYDPDAVPVDGVGHYLLDGALRTVPDGEPAPGPAGEGAYGLSSAAIGAETPTGALSFLTGTRNEPAGGATLLAGQYGGELTPVLSADSLSAPTVAATRTEAWVVRNGSEVVRVPAGGPPQPVAAPTLGGLGRADLIQLSPDGVRAAVVIEGPQGRRLYVGTVVRSEDDGSVVLRDLRAVAPTLAQVIDVGWRDSGSLLVLAGDEGEERIVPYSVGVDGWGLSRVPTSGLPSQPTSLGVAPTRQPLVTADDAIWQLTGGTWSTLVRGAESLPGTAPFYPL
ncbi:LpqB family beta-propeller domain-containing protein [Blastococcus xanthinilyticus]|uniref:Sporulation and spore germination protein n=1 Tax=Blastococcus xanthinilyticus TaxID=1564164 RepID=A0A5S5D5F4_9ACTN|nr:LpqB family beta-propeller domain-containing protein [Blastococcus xanthinilyticus]TYP89899.1 sporulation and spore germination protein [Blastococcus xanthinilyticus]